MLRHINIEVTIFEIEEINNNNKKQIGNGMVLFVISLLIHILNLFDLKWLDGF